MTSEQSRPRGSGEGERPDEGAAPQIRPTLPAAAAQAGPGERTYSEKQVAEILQRAARLERGRALQAPVLSLAEIETIARESGLDPALVRVAARSLEEAQSERSTPSRLLGAPTHRTIERVIDGELTTAHHERLVADLRGALVGSARRPPHISSIGRTLSVSGFTRGAMVELSLTPRDGKTYLRIDVSSGPLAGGLFGGLMGGLGGGMTPLVIGACQATHVGPLGTVLAAAGFVSGAFMLARTIFSWRANGNYRKFEQLADALAARTSEELKR
jgi:hypothetical protein